MNPLKKKPRTKNYNVSIGKPDWLKVRLRFTDSTETSNVNTVRYLLEKEQLNTVCESASCPNLHKCWSNKTATFMLGGDVCTRRCTYCDVATGKPSSLDTEEPKKIAESVKALSLQHVVITSVNRDDLDDGGAIQFYNTVIEIRKIKPDCRIELLIPDFKGKQTSLDLIYSCKPNIINHNIETVGRLFKIVAPQKNYELSLNVLSNIATNGFIAKSGIILGMGETTEEVKDAIKELREVGVSMLTIGQYIQPTPTHHPVFEYVKPEVFDLLKDYGYSLGYKHVESGPLVRSSYHADLQADGLGR
ncbi:MAG: lipoyl synthase [Leptospiraceae bacterium]|nr:lipoyl synthase [Leptospiraceae bacterium]